MSGAVWKGNSEALKAVRQAAEWAIEDGAEHILEHANRSVPHAEGTLELSGDMDQDGTKASIFYDTPYARRQHEDTRIRHKNGRRAKWLEKTLNERSTRIGNYLAAQMRRALG